MKFKTTIRLCAGLLTAGALGAAPALAQEVVKIGYTGPLSGGASPARPPSSPTRRC